MYRRIIRPLLFLLNVEQARRLAIGALRLIGLIPGGRWLLDKCCAVRHPALEREVFGLRFRNPVGLAAGFDRCGEAHRELTALGFGFVEIGTLTPRPQPGNPRPRVFRLPADRAIVHRTGLANRGLATAIRHLRRPHPGVIVGCNIGRNTSTPPENAADDYLKLFRNLYQYADYFSVNIGCGNLRNGEESDIREQILQILDPLFDFRRGQNQYRPVMLKISPDMTDEMIDTVTDILIDTPLDGIVATTGTLDREGLQTDAATLAKIGMGNLSGAPLTQRAIEIVRRIHTRSGGTYPIIGVGGLMNADDVRAMLAAGADLVQLYTGLIYEGPKLVGDICRALAADTEKERAAEQPEEAADPSEAFEQSAPTATSPRQESEDAATTDAGIAGQTPSAAPSDSSDLSDSTAG